MKEISSVIGVLLVLCAMAFGEVGRVRIEGAEIHPMARLQAL